MLGSEFTDGATHPMKTASQIEGEILALQAKVIVATRQKETLSLKLLDTPTDKKAADALKANQADLAQLRSQMEQLQAARNAAARRDAADQQAAEVATIAASAATAVKLARQRATISARIDESLRDLSKLIEEWAATTAECVAATGAVVRAAPRYRDAPAVMDLSRGNGCGHALVAGFLIAENGALAEAGTLMESTVHPAGALSVEDSAQLAADRLKDGLDRLIAASVADTGNDADSLHAPGFIASFENIRATRGE
jgi:hypothetical protein